ncbi:UDP-N-acetylmuramoyl-tripeptide--D-alanyl-D-alanine ligase [Desulforamulus reducens MI-1]|uniref:UDP-N-acetylmuramoyl-tripeptide--D-alanyl-D-alanine ligase n=1 Tax=Desulforamulus reducens (strain ATCC BAA-1160 / DSM 100696 / MI-1) TaxID=349161 RepID=A4J2A7_DESRM|nr:UDP-N-acetylmuramoyl-tripeptide--D-alanyl-D-alanine ligase [Desulforamulus reducens]ABO49210.1 UDP-N-acetylmuramoyl-tripeptide--D-alanyl-D-alanine ligase [Desulforamulus reducens MI-1]
MLTYTIEEIAQVIGGTLLQGDPVTKIKGIHTDSRRAKPRELFVALQGQQADGHDFARKAIEQGASALLVSREITGIAPQIPVVLVKNTLQALQQLASHNRSRLNIPVVAVTGSNGKTSTKDMIAAVLNTRFKTLKTEGNFNNELGLPLTLLGLGEEHQVAVVEMGMRGPGEIDFLAGLAKPTGAVITNIGEAHLERLGSVENIALAKTEVLAHIGRDGFAILNADSPYLGELARNCQGKVWLYSLEGIGDLQASNIRPEGTGVRFNISSPGGKEEIYLPVPGSHNVMNSLAAIGVGLQLGLQLEEIAQGLAQLCLTHSRLQILSSNGRVIINDTYNANPSSTKAALKVLKETARSRKIAVLGNMYELGDLEQSGHQEVGEAAAAIPVDYLISVGNLAQWITQGGLKGGLSQERVFQCQENSEAVEVLGKILKPGDTILVKGSRGMHMEYIVREIMKD